MIWETTQACDLACLHCRASAQSCRNPRELTTEEGYALIDQVKRFGNPLMVFTGGDPLKRPDLFDLIGRSVNAGLRTNIGPSATPLLTTEVIDRLQSIGINRLAICLDGADAQTHDGFRQVSGTFERAMAALRHAREIGLDSQVQTTATRRNLRQLPLIAERVAEVGGKAWSLFVRTVTGRVDAADDLSAQEYEQVFETLYQLSKVMPFEIETTEAMHYSRFAARRLQQEMGAEAELARQVMQVFISHTGDICPSGLPLVAGNVRHDSLVDVFRDFAWRSGEEAQCIHQPCRPVHPAVMAAAQTGSWPPLRSLT